MFGLFPRKGTVAVGSDADLVLFDPAERWTVRAADAPQPGDYSLFEGRQITGRVKKVFLRGQCIVDGEQWLGREGMGQYLQRGASGQPESNGHETVMSPNTCASTAPTCCNACRRWAASGDTGNGGCCRLALTDADKAGRDLVCGWMRELGLRVQRRRRWAISSAGAMASKTCRR
jgi:hypothetical protein